MNEVYVVQHSYEIPDCRHDETKFIGVYTSRSLAEAAVSRLSSQPGFRDTPDAFYIDIYPLDEDHWAEGYMSSAEL